MVPWGGKEEHGEVTPESSEEEEGEEEEGNEKEEQREGETGVPAGEGLGVEAPQFAATSMKYLHLDHPVRRFCIRSQTPQHC